MCTHTLSTKLLFANISSSCSQRLGIIIIIIIIMSLRIRRVSHMVVSPAKYYYHKKTRTEVYY
jgi:hypothetical protein